ncbi:hypothetical protein [Oceanobacillus neutriphilus]|uniref:Uncharacterized protein n=1 Tax=Oceanobacillus neutriphilus TaxID=531815 RepID=A0ABQ2P3F1_9BACI|nr:hypothetical protein [Oceanobacillus neutriphilus]GGP17261.1 hypothetical protein GCM10011346_52420 [Oceanobacillus neutriphilus]
MEKIQVTQKQADWLERYELTQEQIDHYINIQPYKKRPDSPIVDWDAAKLARALYVGYEVIPQYKVGDWVVYVPDNSIWEITKDTYNDGTHINLMNGNEIMNVVSANHLRHATPEEIQQEKKRRFWERLGREVDEYRQGDIVTTGFGNYTSITKLEMNKKSVYFDGPEAERSFDEIYLVAPEEQRMDK